MRKPENILKVYCNLYAVGVSSSVSYFGVSHPDDWKIKKKFIENKKLMYEKKEKNLAQRESHN